MRVTIFTILAVLSLAGCSGSTVEDANLGPWELDNPVVDLPQAPLGVGGDLTRIASAPTVESVRLGRWLFFDKRLSVDNTISCASCHVSSAAFSSTTAVSTGVHGQLGKRKAPPIINLAFAPRPFFFWDGRAGSLEEQALQPIENPIEMGLSETEVVAKLQAVASYPEYFRRAFQSSTISIDLIARALAAYERTRMSGNSAFDQWRGNRSASYPAQAVEGFSVFQRVRCDSCHGGPSFSDFDFHNTGVAWDATNRVFADSGRFAATNDTRDEGAFRTPTLRDLSVRAPYMHDGSQATLEAVVDFYDRGGVNNPNLDRRMRPLRLRPTERDALVAFLKTLSGEGFADEGPASFPQ